MQEAFLDELELVVTRQKKLKIKRDEAWLSEAEMRSEYGWSALLT